MHKLLIALCLLPLSLAASELPDYPFVYVRGEASRSIAPDEATITFRIKTFAAQAERASGLQADAADSVLKFSSRLGIPADAIVAQSIEKSSVRKEDDKGNQLEIIGYDNVRSVQINVKDLALFPKLIEFLYAQPNIEDISAKFWRTDEKTIMQALTDDACKAADESAIRLAKGFHQKPKRVRAISEYSFSGLGNEFGLGPERSIYLNADANGKSREDFRVIPATISFGKTVCAIYEIE